MTRLLILLLALAPLAACSNDHEDASHTDGRSDTEDAEGFGGPLRGEVLEVATSSGDEMEVGVTSEVLFLRLSDASRKEAREEMGREVPDEGLGGAIGRAVTGFVDDALGTTVQIPLEDVTDLRYDNGRLVFEADGSFANVQIDEDDNDGIPFDEADAERLIEAFERAR